MTFEEKITQYAKLAVQVGVNIQPNQPLFVSISTDNILLARAITKEAYAVGAKQVYVDFSDDEITHTRYHHAPQDSFDEFPSWKIAEREQLMEQGAAFLSVVSQSPDLLTGVEPIRIANFQKAAGQALANFRRQLQADKFSWSVIAAPSPNWAKKVFPDLSEDEQVPTLWEAIFESVRLNEEDPVQAWQQHNDELHRRANYLTTKQYKTLHYTAPGTDLTIDLPTGHIWCGASSTTQDGQNFMANMPTEEVFTAPDRLGVNGTVCSTKPLSYGGTLIDQFTLTFKNGKVVQAVAQQGEEVLNHLLTTDEGARFLGEVALVPHPSPISQSGILFYNTLFDENASNHLAIGSAYAFCLTGGKEMTPEQLVEAGLNESITHVDFMIGSDKMNIDGILTNGTVEPIFRSGDWAF